MYDNLGDTIRDFLSSGDYSDFEYFKNQANFLDYNEKIILSTTLEKLLDFFDETIKLRLSNLIYFLRSGT